MTDLRYAIRMLLKSPGFSLIAVLTLALGIGANSAIFSLVDAVLLKPPHFRDPGQLVWVWATRKNVPRAFYSIPNLRDTRAQSQTIDRWIAFTSWGANLRGAQETERLQGIKISADGLQDLGIVPAVGRVFGPEDQKLENSRVVILGYGLWQRRFGGDPHVIGTNQLLNDESYTVIGVLPREMVLPNAELDLVAPLNFETDSRRAERGTNFLRLIARLKPGVTPLQTEAELAAITDRLRLQFPTDNGNLTPPRVLRLQEEIAGEYHTVLVVVFGAVIAVLLIACANLANLQLARASTRYREFAIRSALGATRWHLLRQLLFEGLLLATIGGSLGLLLSTWGKDLLVRLAPPDFPQAASVTIDLSVFLFCLLISILAGLMLGLLPAFRATSTDLNADLKSSSPSAGVDRARSRARNALIIAEVALSLTLLVCAGLLIKSLARLEKVNPGFDYEHALAVRLALPPAKYADGPAAKSFYDELAPPLETIPGIESIGAISALPMSGLMARTEFLISGRPPPQPSEVPGAYHRWVTPGYFRTMHMSLLRGRDFNEHDQSQTAGVAVIDEALAHRFFADADPIGAHLRITLGDGASDRDYEIVGMVENVKHSALSEEPQPTFYGPMPQIPKPVAGFLANNFSLVIRSKMNPETAAEVVRRQLRKIDPGIAVSSVRPLEQLVSASVAVRRFNLILLGSFAGAALLLAAVGLYAVIAFLVTARTREIGVRLALGAQQTDIMSLIFGQALKLVAAGVAFGLIGSIAATRGLTTLLFGTSATDPVTYVVVAILLAIAALLATYLPARRAMKVDPMVALHQE